VGIAVKFVGGESAKNPQRDKYFRVLAEVWIDGESLGQKLKSGGFAKDYDGEGARPEW